MAKKKIGIVVDSSAGYTKVEAKKRGFVGMVPLNIEKNGTTYQDGINIDTKTFEAELNVKDKIQTSAPTPGAFKEVFEEGLKSYDELIYVGLSYKVSATQQSAITCLDSNKHLQGKVHIVKSKFFGAFLNYYSLRWLKMAEIGKSKESIIQDVEECEKSATGVLYSETLTFLKNGGRISGSKALVGNALKLMPILTWKDGSIDPKEAKKGRALEKTQDKTIEVFKKMFEKFGKKDYMVLGMFPQNSSKTEQKVFKNKVCIALEIPEEDIFDSYAAGVLIGHLGPKYMGIGIVKRNKF